MFKVHELLISSFQGRGFVDLAPYQYGRETCEPGHSFGPARRTRYLFHYIIAGRGTLYATDDTGTETRYRLTPSEGFTIFPDQLNTYTADEEDPWQYAWVEFDGISVGERLAEVGLTTSSPVYHAKSPEEGARLLQEMLYLVEHRRARDLQLIGHTYLFLDALLDTIEPPYDYQDSAARNVYVRNAISYIEQHYNEGITVADIARQSGLSRSYFAKVFKRAQHKSPQQYLMDYRMDKAAELLRISVLPIGEVSRSVGYDNQLNFSRAFKGVYGCSPSDWRNAHA